MKYTNFQIQFSRNLSFREMYSGAGKIVVSIQWKLTLSLYVEHSDVNNG